MLLRNWASFLLLLLASALLDAAEPEPLAKRVEAILDAPVYKSSTWGVVVVDAKTGETLYQRNQDKLMAPASLTKLITTSCSLLAFGEKYRFETPVFALGNVNPNGLFTGNIVLVASGDPSFCGRSIVDDRLDFQNNDHTYANSGFGDCVACAADPRLVFDDIAKAITDAGIREIRGEILIDDRLFNLSRSSGSGPDIISPMCINDNVVDVIITPSDKPGELAKIKVKPETVAITIDAQVKTVARHEANFVELIQNTSNTFSIRGQVPANGQPVLRILPIEDPAGVARVMLIEALQRAKVPVSALIQRPSATPLPAPAAYAQQLPLVLRRSAPFSEVLKVTLKTSHNLYASQLPCLLAAKNGKTTLNDGLRLLRPLLRLLGLDPNELALGSGSGGSISDQLTPKSFTTLFASLANTPAWDKYKTWLPELGHDGTLADLVDEKHRLYRKVLAKTGTHLWTDSLNNRPFLRTKALAGTMTTHSGRELYFAFIVNDVPIKPTTSVRAISLDLINLCDVFYDE